MNCCLQPANYRKNWYDCARNTKQVGDVISRKTGIQLRRLSVNVCKFGRTTVRPAFFLSAFKPCAEILPARIGTVFGSLWRNRRVSAETADATMNNGFADYV